MTWGGGEPVVTSWCPQHLPIQYHNAVPAECGVCGFDRDGRQWILVLEVGRPVVMAVAEGVDPSEDDLRDMEIARRAIEERNRAWVEAISRES